MGLPNPSWWSAVHGVAGVPDSLVLQEGRWSALAVRVLLELRLGLIVLRPHCLSNACHDAGASTVDLSALRGLPYSDVCEAITAALSLTRTCWRPSSSLRNTSTSSSHSDSFFSNSAFGKESSCCSPLSLSCLTLPISSRSSLTCCCSKSRSRACFCNRSENSAFTTFTSSEGSSANWYICARKPSNSISALEVTDEHTCCRWAISASSSLLSCLVFCISSMRFLVSSNDFCCSRTTFFLCAVKTASIFLSVSICKRRCKAAWLRCMFAAIPSDVEDRLAPCPVVSK
mmetsp:Transcript_13522/g.37473  ORF Transcript_13522/g.37473 Transcript_13522/m.37473 type:complete len:287 (-) Transcript_13522:456-1316(-)